MLSFWFICVIYRIKTVDISGIPTHIVEEDGMHTDHLTTTTPHYYT